MDGSVQGCWDSSFSISTRNYYSSWYTQYSRYCWLGARLVKRAYLGRRRPRRLQIEQLHTRPDLNRCGHTIDSTKCPVQRQGAHRGIRLHVWEERLLGAQRIRSSQPRVQLYLGIQFDNWSMERAPIAHRWIADDELARASKHQVARRVDHRRPTHFEFLHDQRGVFCRGSVC